ncbi:hypothetical protein J4H86_04270 [Spiractinospora alimapuensis]|uniref:hypothetical protein n=1 Tax=Spiractinospora alimapuensis TaxID=2820884 RepID=UPI001F3A6F87|nr:hypothetical protein [Spiractinospora alimapuensis]QVQ53027.1 hypothetical protein J4H86_04270 [Spiractinospora alimapuensis]
MGEIGLFELVLLVAMLAAPLAILGAAVVYVVRVARLGPAETLNRATRRRNLPQ